MRVSDDGKELIVYGLRFRHITELQIRGTAIFDDGTKLPSYIVIEHYLINDIAVSMIRYFDELDTAKRMERL